MASSDIQDAENQLVGKIKHASSERVLCSVWCQIIPDSKGGFSIAETEDWRTLKKTKWDGKELGFQFEKHGSISKNLQTTPGRVAHDAKASWTSATWLPFL